LGPVAFIVAQLQAPHSAPGIGIESDFVLELLHESSVAPESAAVTEAAAWWRRAWALRSTRAALGLLVLLALLAVVGPWLRPYSAETTDWAQIGVAPGIIHGHWLGSDAIGRDVLVRTLLAGRVSLLVALGAGGLALLLGLGYGTLAGALGGWRERAMMRVLDVLSALPFLLIVVLLLTLFGRHLLLLVAAIAAYVCLDLARMVRAEAARIRPLPYITAAIALGANTAWILRRHLLPNVFGFALVYLTLAIPQAILVESFLSFLGLGIDEPAVSLGTLLAEGVAELSDAPWVLIVPATFMVLLLLALTALGDALRLASRASTVVVALPTTTTAGAVV